MRSHSARAGGGTAPGAVHSRGGPAGSNMNDAGYPFRGVYKLDRKLNHGHGGVSRPAPTTVAMKITGRGIIISELTVPKAQHLDCELSHGNGRTTASPLATVSHTNDHYNDGLSKPHLIAFPHADSALAVPDDGRDYHLTAIVTGANHQKHYCRLVLQSSGVASEGDGSEKRTQSPPRARSASMSAAAAADGGSTATMVPISAAPDARVQLEVSVGGGSPAKGGGLILLRPDAANGGQFHVPAEAVACRIVPDPSQSSMLSSAAAPAFVSVTCLYADEHAPHPSTGTPQAPPLMIRCDATGEAVPLLPFGTATLPANRGPLTLLMPRPVPAHPSSSQSPRRPSASSAHHVPPPEIVTDLTPSPCGRRVTVSASAAGCHIVITAPGSEPAVGLAVASLTLDAALSHRVRITASDPQHPPEHMVLARSTITVPANIGNAGGSHASNAAAPMLVRVADEAASTAEDEQRPLLTISGDNDTSVAVDGRAAGPVGAAATVDATSPHTCDLTQHRTGASVRLQLSGRQGNSGGSDDKRWLRPLAALIQKAGGRPDVLLQGLPSINPLSPDGIALCRYLGDLLSRPPPTIDLTPSPDGKELAFVRCSGFGITAAHGSSGTPCLIQQGGSVAIPLSSDLVLAAVDQNTGLAAAKVVLRSGAGSSALGPSNDDRAYLEAVLKTLQDHHAVPGPSTDPLGSDHLHRAMAALPRRGDLPTRVHPLLVDLCRPRALGHDAEAFINALLRAFVTHAHGGDTLWQQALPLVPVATPTQRQLLDAIIEALGRVGNMPLDLRAPERPPGMDVFASVDGGVAVPVGPAGTGVPRGAKSVAIAVRAALGDAAGYADTASAFIRDLASLLNEKRPTAALREALCRFRATTPAEGDLLRAILALLQDQERRLSNASSVAAAVSPPIPQTHTPESDDLMSFGRLVRAGNVGNLDIALLLVGTTEFTFSAVCTGPFLVSASVVPAASNTAHASLSAYQYAADGAANATAPAVSSSPTAPAKSATVRLDGTVPNTVHLRTHDSSGRVITESRLQLPRLANPPGHLRYTADGALHLQPGPSTLFAAAVDGSAERVASFPIPLDLDAPHHVRVRHYHAAGKSATLGEITVDLPILIHAPDIEDVTRIYRNYGRRSPVSMGPALEQLAHRAKNSATRRLIEAILEALPNVSGGHNHSRGGCETGDDNNNSQWQDSETQRGGRRTKTVLHESADGSNGQYGSSKRSIFFRLRGDERK